MIYESPLDEFGDERDTNSSRYNIGAGGIGIDVDKYVEHSTFNELLELFSIMTDQINEQKVQNKLLEDRIKTLETWKEV